MYKPIFRFLSLVSFFVFVGIVHADHDLNPNTVTYSHYIATPEADCITEKICLSRGLSGPLRQRPSDNPFGWISDEDPYYESLKWYLGTVAEMQNTDPNNYSDSFEEVIGYDIGDKMEEDFIPNQKPVALLINSPDDGVIWVEFRFHSWTKGYGGFSYTRTIDGVQEYFESKLVGEGDCLTKDVCLSRGPIKPLFNSKQRESWTDGYDESKDDPNLSWSRGTIEDAKNGAPTGTFPEILDTNIGSKMEGEIIPNGEAMTLHLLNEDLYFEIYFHHWGGGENSASCENSSNYEDDACLSFSYTRTTTDYDVGGFSTNISVLNTIGYEASNVDPLGETYLDNSAQLTFGFNPWASNGLDENESERPPKPPAGIFDARFLIEGTNGSFTDIKPLFSSAEADAAKAETAVWYLDIQAGSHRDQFNNSIAAFPIYITWNPEDFTGDVGSFNLRDRLTGNFINIDMSQTNKLELTGEIPLEIFYQSVPPCEHKFTLTPGWHMISMPCNIDSWIDQPFAGSSSNVITSMFEFDGRYKQIDLTNAKEQSRVKVGKGYWIKLNGAFSGTITGSHSPEIGELDIKMGWNLVGPGLYPVGSLGQAGVISVFGQDNNTGGYAPALQMAPGKGYWLNMANEGYVDLSGSNSIANNRAMEKPIVNLPLEKGLNHAILWAESDGIQQLLHLGVDPKDVKALPPLPPSGMFDIRFEVGNVGAWQVPHVSETKDYRLRLQGGPIQLGWKISQEDSGLWQLLVNERVIDLQGEGMVGLDPDVDQVFVRQAIGQGLPQAFKLAQNFPNPFNPATTIQYSLPEATSVSLKIYDIAGQVIRHLIEQKQVAGSHQVVWDGLDQSGVPTANGVYFYELKAGEFRALRKMLLLK